VVAVLLSLIPLLAGRKVRDVTVSRGHFLRQTVQLSFKDRYLVLSPAVAFRRHVVAILELPDSERPNYRS
jgi:hypothetical protein